MAQNDLTNTIMEERIQIGLDIVKRISEKNSLKLSNFEQMDLAVRIGASLFIEKNKSFRASQIQR